MILFGKLPQSGSESGLFFLVIPFGKLSQIFGNGVGGVRRFLLVESEKLCSDSVQCTSVFFLLLGKAKKNTPKKLSK